MIGRTVEKAILFIYLMDITARNSTIDSNTEINTFHKYLIKKTDKALKSEAALKQNGYDNFFSFEVQYNPATIRLNTSSSTVNESDSEIGAKSNSVEKNKNNEKVKKDTKTPQKKTDTFVESKLSFELIFDDCNGVRKKMDSIMSLLSSSFTQQVIFYWSQMVFRGTVTSVSNTYTMFDSHGTPIRGNMNLSISQKIENTEVNDKLYWDKAFDKYFKSSSKKRLSIKKLFDNTEKAVLEIADFSERQVEKTDATAPNSGKGAIGFHASVEDFIDKIKNYGKSVSGDDDNEVFISFKGFNSYRFECQFNPESLSLSGSGSSEMPTINKKSRSEDTTITLSFTLIFDKTDSKDSSVQPEVEALTAIVRDKKKQMASFTWGKKSYQGVINSIEAEYKMFNSNYEPVRASAMISMTVYDESISGALSEIWANRYMNYIYNAK